MQYVIYLAIVIETSGKKRKKKQLKPTTALLYDVIFIFILLTETRDHCRVLKNHVRKTPSHSLRLLQ
jgi:hypothetical protein